MRGANDGVGVLIKEPSIQSTCPFSSSSPSAVSLPKLYLRSQYMQVTWLRNGKVAAWEKKALLPDPSELIIK